MEVRLSHGEAHRTQTATTFGARADAGGLALGIGAEVSPACSAKRLRRSCGGLRFTVCVSSFVIRYSSFPNPMPLPSRSEAQRLLESHVHDEYQRLHALMVGTAMAGYAPQFGGDETLWFLTGYLHDIDFEEHPDTHPAESLRWFSEWGYPTEMIHAVEAHAYGYHGYTTLPQTKLAAALVACDEISGIFYAYRKMNPVRYSEMKASSIKKKFKDTAFAAKIDRDTITMGCEQLGVSLDDHIANLVRFFAPLP
jgi:predicted hydrolase (HD superfamily)